MSPGSKGTVAALLSALSLSTMGVFGKFLYQDGVHPLNVVTLRAIIAFVTLGAALALLRGRLPRIEPGHILLFAALGLIGISCNYAAFFLALDLATLSTAIVLLYTYPVFVMLGAVLFLNERFTMVKLAALSATLLGCIFITQAYDPAALRLNFWGVMFGFAASLTKAVYTLLSKRFLRHYDPWTTVFYAFGFGAFFLLLFVAPSGLFDLDLSAHSWFLIAAIAWLPTLIGYSLFVVALNYLDASRASVLATLEPVAAVVLAALLLGETIAAIQVAGVAAVVFGIVLLHLPHRRGQVVGQ